MGSKLSKGRKSSNEATTSPSSIRTTKPIVTVNQMLYFKSNEVSPPSEFIREGNKIANDLFNILRSCRQDVDRVIVAATIGKRTPISNSPDFSLVIFLNNSKPPYSAVLRQLKHALDDRSADLRDYKFISKAPMAITFEVSGFQCELFPAINLQLKDVPSSQYEGTCKVIETLPNPIAKGYRYSPGFSESTIQFIRSQTPFYHQIIHLAKHWDNNINTGCYIRGRSLIIELIAVKSCEETDGIDFYVTLKRFLEKINEFPKLRIFTEYFYFKTQIPKEILEYDGPIIMDPVNCYNNMTRESVFPASVISIFVNAAEISLRRLVDWRNNPKADDQSFDRIFEPYS